VLNASRGATASTTCPRSMAPEIYHSNTMNVYTDVYAFGIILWELLTFRVPYEGEATVPAIPFDVGVDLPGFYHAENRGAASWDLGLGWEVTGWEVTWGCAGG
jgi:hypothetical protein